MEGDNNLVQVAYTQLTGWENRARYIPTRM